MSIQYGFGKTVATDFDNAIEKVTAELADEVKSRLERVLAAL